MCCVIICYVKEDTILFRIRTGIDFYRGIELLLRKWRGCITVAPNLWWWILLLFPEDRHKNSDGGGNGLKQDVSIGVVAFDGTDRDTSDPTTVVGKDTVLERLGATVVDDDRSTTIVVRIVYLIEDPTH